MNWKNGQYWPPSCATVHCQLASMEPRTDNGHSGHQGICSHRVSTDPPAELSIWIVSSLSLSTLPWYWAQMKSGLTLFIRIYYLTWRVQSREKLLLACFLLRVKFLLAFSLLKGKPPFSLLLTKARNSWSRMKCLIFSAVWGSEWRHRARGCSVRWLARPSGTIDN